MTNEEALMVLQDIFDGWSRWVPKNGSPAHKNLEALGVAIDALRDKWISVEDGLPEIGKCVLVRQIYHPFNNGHGEFEEVTVGYLHQPMDNRRKPYFYWIAVSDYGDMVRAESICPGSKYITHWQPLPEPPVTTRAEPNDGKES